MLRPPFDSAALSQTWIRPNAITTFTAYGMLDRQWRSSRKSSTHRRQPVLASTFPDTDLSRSRPAKWIDVSFNTKRIGNNHPGTRASSPPCPWINTKRPLAGYTSDSSNAPYKPSLLLPRDLSARRCHVQAKARCDLKSIDRTYTLEDSCIDARGGQPPAVFCATHQ